MNNKVILGDNMEYMKDCKDNQFDLAIVDPPYGIKRAGHAESISKNGKKQWHKYYEDKGWDNETPNQEYFDELRRISKNQIIWGGNYFTDKLPVSRCWVFWYKGQKGLSMADGELSWTSFDKVARQFDLHRTHLWQEGTIHPTQKPIKLYKWLLQNYAKPNDKIFDSHVGSGSIRIACHDMGFDFTGCEIDKDYWNNQEARFKKHTQQGDLFGGEELQDSIYHGDYVGC